ncbi:hypothetical protein AYI68_g3129 [Smittium mucronatum]|uniref:Uncharacterized protein n=1 Tax=Smittium mucronatum TaxID=133383 RepID=A0A1R0H0S7_9FUNG|nr:hypothetical protein AYI68_g3129 [Smittium mucronatum]
MFLYISFSEGISFDSSMGMVMRNHELVDSGNCTYELAPDANTWRELAEDRDRDVSASIFIDAFELNEDLDQ